MHRDAWAVAQHRYRLPEPAGTAPRRDNPLHLPLFPHVASLVHNLLRGGYFTPEEWGRWFDFYAMSSSFGVVCDIFRNVEYLFTEKELRLEAGLRILDIGTGASVFPCYLRQRAEVDLVILDLDDYGFEDQRHYFHKSGLPVPRLIRGDAVRPSFQDESFDRVVAVSAIEHFPGDGDTAFMEQAWRLLKPGGRCIVTVPYCAVYQENSDVHHYHGGFERRYNREALKERLWSSGDWVVEKELYLNPAETPLTRKLILRHGRLDFFFDQWYASRSNLLHTHDSLWYTLLLIDLAETPGEGCFGTCFALRRPGMEGADRE